jgi:hypothetical protein
VFVPIPGAPGFIPDEYDWDKGFSAALEHEAVTDQISSSSSSILRKGKPQQQQQPLQSMFLEPRPHSPMTISKSPSPSPASVNIGEYIEKKAGGVELVGRRINTTPVLTPEIADKVCIPSSFAMPYTHIYLHM